MANITRWNPVRELANMQSMMDRMFEDFWGPLSETNGTTLGDRTLALDIHADDDGYTVVTEMPGLKADDIKVHLEGNYLIIERELPEQTHEREDKRAIMRERRYGRYSRSVRLPQAVDPDNVEAHYEDGVLTLTLPFAEEARPRMIPVKVSTS